MAGTLRITDSADSDADEATDIFGIEFILTQSALGISLPSRNDRELSKPLNPAGHFRIEVIARIEALDLGRDPARQL